MLVVHLSVNNKPALIQENNILFVEECEGEDKEKNHVEFTRLYFKQPVTTTEDPIVQIDIVEKVEKLLKMMK